MITKCYNYLTSTQNISFSTDKKTPFRKNQQQKAQLRQGSGIRYEKQNLFNGFCREYSSFFFNLHKWVQFIAMNRILYLYSTLGTHLLVEPHFCLQSEELCRTLCDPPQTIVPLLLKCIIIISQDNCMAPLGGRDNMSTIIQI